MSKSQVSRLCREIGETHRRFSESAGPGDRPYLWIDATHVRARQASRIASVAVVSAVILTAFASGVSVGTSGAEPFWTISCAA
jgi:putative transposase